GLGGAGGSGGEDSGGHRRDETGKSDHRAGILAFRRAAVNPRTRPQSVPDAIPPPGNSASPFANAVPRDTLTVSTLPAITHGKNVIRESMGRAHRAHDAERSDATADRDASHSRSHQPPGLRNAARSRIEGEI